MNSLGVISLGENICRVDLYLVFDFVIKQIRCYIKENNRESAII
jgi:hypothetical protein